MLLDVCADVQCAIFSRLTKAELTTLSQCSRRCNELVQPMIWSSMNIPVKRLKEPFNWGLLPLCKDVCLKGRGFLWPWEAEEELDKDLIERFILFLDSCSPKILRLQYDPIMSAKFSVSHMNALTELYIENRDFEDELVDKILSDCVSKLKVLSVQDSSNTDKAFLSIHKFDCLKKLDIVSTDITDETLKIVDGSTLEELNLSENIKLTNQGFKLVSTWKSLQRLSVYGFDGSFTDGRGCIGLTSLEYLSTLQLKELDISYDGVEDSGLQCISSMTELEVLNLSNNEITDDGLVHLSQLMKLRELDLSCNYFFGRKISCLLGLPIAKLRLGGTRITSTELKEFHRFTSLRELSLAECADVTGAGIRYLAEVKSLGVLDVSDTPLEHEDYAALKIFANKRKEVTIYPDGILDNMDAESTSSVSDSEDDDEGEDEEANESSESASDID